MPTQQNVDAHAARANTRDTGGGSSAACVLATLARFGHLGEEGDTKWPSLGGRNDLVTTSQDRLLWSQARTLEDVAVLTALWLEGEVKSQPAYAPNCGPDAETEDLIPVLCLANQAGLLTSGSQPGHEPRPGTDGAIWAQRAAVEGFIHPGPLREQLCAHATAAGLIVIIDGRSDRVEATTRDGQACTWFGDRYNVYYDDPLCPAGAAGDIERATHICIIDPRFENSSELWEILELSIRASA